MEMCRSYHLILLMTLKTLAVNANAVKQYVYLPGHQQNVIQNLPIPMNQANVNQQVYTFASPTTVLPQMASNQASGQLQRYPFPPPVAQNPPGSPKGNIFVSLMPPPPMTAQNTIPTPGIQSASNIPAFNTGMLPPGTSSPPAMKTAEFTSVLPAAMIPNPQQVLQDPCTSNVPSLNSESNSNLDSSILNNLAIALQLLIVNNILSKPLPEFKSDRALLPLDIIPTFLPLKIDLPDPVSYPSYGVSSQNNFMPNANLMGLSAMSSPSMLGLAPFNPSTRSSLTLMSPYEALGPSSTFSDTILSSPFSSQFDFQSPYASILSDSSDLFSMTDLF